MLSRTQTRQLRGIPTAAGRVEAAMLAMGWNQEELEARSGVPQSTVSKVLRGIRTNVSLVTAQRLAKAFGCQIEDLFPELDSVAA